MGPAHTHTSKLILLLTRSLWEMMLLMSSRGLARLMLSSVVFGLISCPSTLAQLHWHYFTQILSSWEWHLCYTENFWTKNNDCFVFEGCNLDSIFGGWLPISICKWGCGVCWWRTPSSRAERGSRWPEILSFLSSIHQRSHTNTLEFIVDPSKEILLTSFEPLIILSSLCKYPLHYVKQRPRSHIHNICWLFIRCGSDCFARCHVFCLIQDNQIPAPRAWTSVTSQHQALPLSSPDSSHLRFDLRIFGWDWRGFVSQLINIYLNYETLLRLLPNISKSTQSQLNKI